MDKQELQRDLEKILNTINRLSEMDEPSTRGSSIVEMLSSSLIALQTRADVRNEKIKNASEHIDKAIKLVKEYYHVY